MTMNEHNLFLGTLALFGLFVSGILWVAFGRYSMARIEREIEAELKRKMFLWDGIGARLPYYALYMFAPKCLHKGLSEIINPVYIQSRATRVDKILAASLLIMIFLSAALLIAAYNNP